MNTQHVPLLFILSGTLFPALLNALQVNHFDNTSVVDTPDTIGLNAAVHKDLTAKSFSSSSIEKQLVHFFSSLKKHVTSECHELMGRFSDKWLSSGGALNLVTDYSQSYASSNTFHNKKRRFTNAINDIKRALFMKDDVLTSCTDVACKTANRSTLLRRAGKVISAEGRRLFIRGGTLSTILSDVEKLFDETEAFTTCMRGISRLSGSMGFFELIGGIDKSNYDDALVEVNRKRQCHLNTGELATCPGAVQWADRIVRDLAATGGSRPSALRHSDPRVREGCGENLAWRSDGYFPFEAAVDLWYDEMESPGYDWYNPGYTSGTGQFTQMIWSDHKSIGCAQHAGYVVCLFCQNPGNVLGNFRQNVFPIMEDICDAQGHLLADELMTMQVPQPPRAPSISAACPPKARR